MHAAVVNAWGDAPEYSDFSLPPPTDSQVRIRIVAAGVHTLVRSRAAGKHFSTAGKNPPHIPGVDGVGTVAETGKLVYFNCLMAPTGSLAEEINVNKSDIFPLPKGADPDIIAVIVNATLSSWMAFSARAGVTPGSEFSVAIVGATGVSGQAAVQISKAMGATEIVAIGKPGAKLDKTTENGATATVAFAEKLDDTDFSAAADVDIVLDYLWGDVTKAVIPGIISKRKNKSQRLSWIEIGSLGGEHVPIPASTLRMANVVFMGCGPGSWTFPELNAQMPEMLKAIAENGLETDFEVKSLKDVKSWWNDKGGARPLVKP